MKPDAADLSSSHRPSVRIPKGLLGVAVPIVLIAGVAIMAGARGGSIAERTMSGTWHRAVDADPSIIQALGDGEHTGIRLQPASTGDTVRAPVIGERVTLVAPDGTIRTLRICDPASPSATSAPDCLNAYVSKAIPPSNETVRQRSL